MYLIMDIKSRKMSEKFKGLSLYSFDWLFSTGGSFGALVKFNLALVFMNMYECHTPVRWD